MSVFLSPYDTTPFRGAAAAMAKVQEGLEKAALNDRLEYTEDGLLLCQNPLTMQDIPAFAHPIMVRKGTRQEFALDVRPFVAWKPDGSYRVKNTIGYDLMIARGNLQHIWLEQSITGLRDISSIPMKVYAHWISENIARRFNLDPLVILKVTITAAFFYQCLFHADAEKLPNDEKNRMAASIVKALGSPADLVFEVLDLFDKPINNAIEFCEAIKLVTGSISLENFNAGVLYSVLGASFYDSNAQELMAVCVEHPPTWLVVLYRAAVDQSYKKTGIRMLMDRQKRANVEQFIRSLASMILIYRKKPHQPF